MDILCLGQQNWDHCWTGKQQLTSRLAERGHRVLYVDPDIPGHAEIEAIRAASLPGIPGLRHRGPGDLWTYSYLPIRRPRLRPAGGAGAKARGAEGEGTQAPAPTSGRPSGFGVRLNRALQIRGLGGMLRKVGFHAPVAFCLHPKQILNLERSNPQALVYYAVDEYTAYGGMTDETRRRVRSWEDEILARADVALGVSPDLQARFARSCGASHVLENGSDVDHYRPEKLARIAPHAALAGLEGPVIGFIGQVDSRLDQALIEAIARRRPGWTLAFAGRRTVDLGRLEALPNVRFLGYQPYEALPSIAKRVDVWTVPYVENELTHACNPLKVYEYLATGKPVVSRPLNGLIICRDVVALAGEPCAFEGAIEAALAEPGAGRAERLRRAEDNDWYARVVRLEEHFEEAVGRSRKSGRWMSAMTPLPPARRLGRALDGGRFVNEYGSLRSPRRVATWRAFIAGFRAVGMLLHLGRFAGRLVGRPDRPERILVAWRGHLGDFIALTPMLGHLRRCFPGARISLGLHRNSIGPALFANSPHVDDFVPLEFAPMRVDVPLRQRLRGCVELLARRFDLVVGGASWFFMEEGQLTGAPRYVGLYDGHPLQGMQGRLLRRDHARHEAENDLALVEALSGEIAADEDRQPRLHFDEAEVAARRRAVLDQLSIGAGDRVLLVHPGSKVASRRWPAERLAETVARLLDRLPDLVVVVTGTDGEKALVEGLIARLARPARGRVRDAAGRTDLAGLAGLLDRADAVLSSDTGVMHFARLRGAPLVALLGPENHKLWGPHPMGDAPAHAIRREVPCAPCRVHDCAAHYCMKSVSVDEVEGMVLKMLERGRDAAPGAAALELDWQRLSWNALAREGFALPTVSVIVEDMAGESNGGADVLAGVLPVIERQTYPRIEIVHLRRRGAPWADARDEERRRTLPITAVEVGVEMDGEMSGEVGGEVGGGPEEAMAAATRAARGELLVRAVPGIDWRPSRLALDVAAATRAMVGTAFYDGRPVAGEAARPDALMQRSAAPPSTEFPPADRPQEPRELGRLGTSVT